MEKTAAVRFAAFYYYFYCIQPLNIFPLVLSDRDPLPGDVEGRAGLRGDPGGAGGRARPQARRLAREVAYSGGDPGETESG